MISHTSHIRGYIQSILRKKYWAAQLYETQARHWQKRHFFHPYFKHWYEEIFLKITFPQQALYLMRDLGMCTTPYNSSYDMRRAYHSAGAQQVQDG